MKRESSTGLMSGNRHVYATGVDDPAMAVRMELGRSVHGGSFSVYQTTDDARTLAAALIEAADYYDAETARLAQVAA